MKERLKVLGSSIELRLGFVIKNKTMVDCMIDDKKKRR